jgi:molecular chaperone DnaK
MNVGIDLGTSYSLVARVQPDRTVSLMPDCVQQDLFHTPSVVCFAHRAAYVGRMAEVVLEEEPHLTAIRFFKRQLGSRDAIHFDQDGAAWRAEGVAALLLKKLRFDAELSAPLGVDGAVLSVPAHFSDPQRQAMMAAAMMADIPVLGLIEEPVAAALHYGTRRNGAEPRVLLVFDWGGGTCDVSIVACDASTVTVLAKGGVAELGGKEVDERLGALILSASSDPDARQESLSARGLLDLRRVSEELKIELCSPTRPPVARTVLLGDRAVEIRVAQSLFDRAVAPLVDQCEAAVAACIDAAHLVPDNIDDVLLVGGSSMVPAARDRMERIFPRRVRYHEPAKAVAFGAAIHAAQLSGEARALDLPAVLRGVTGHATGIRVVDPHTGRVTVDPIVPQNVPLPARAARTYFSTRADQQRIVLEIVQSRINVPGAVYLGKLVVGPLPRPRLNYPVDVAIEVRTDETVAVSACDAETGLELHHQFARDDETGASALANQHALVRRTVVNQL